MTTLISKLQLIALLTLLLITGVNANEASPPLQPLRTFNENEQVQNLSYLTKRFGNSKSLPEEFELQALLALSYLPELLDI